MCDMEDQAKGREPTPRQETGSLGSGFWLRGILMAIGCVLFAVTTAVFADSWLLGGVGASGAVAWASLMTWFDHRSELPVNPVARQYLILGFFYLMVCLVLIASWAFGLPAA